MAESSFNDAAAVWNQRFARTDYIFGREPNVYLRAQAARLAPGGTVLCVADGEGRNSVWLAQQGMQVEAFDIAAAGVAKARDLAAAVNIDVAFSVADCDSWPWRTGAYDAVVAIFVQFADPPMRARLFANMVAALKPGGLLILQGYTPKQLEFKTGGPPFASHMYTEDLLRTAFAALEIIDLREEETDLAEGVQHLGRSAVIGLVARKP